MASDAYKGLDIERITSEVLFSAAIDGLNQWKDGITEGTGDAGSRPPWVNTGEGRGSITLKPPTPGALEYLVGSERIQVLIAEVGRAPGSSPPPYGVIAEWVKEKGIAQPGSAEFPGIVNAIRWSIAQEGIKPFRPAAAAGRRSMKDLDQRLVQRIEADLRRR